jgi:glycosyltransferase involved in cell wall biosynthesis
VPGWDAAGGNPDVVVIATFRRDEPIAAIVSAAAMMHDREFVLTGHASAFQRLGIELPSNVQLTDYLPESRYWAVLAAASVVCDLTLKEDCLVCGAYEALSLGKPMVLTDDSATRALFGPAAVLARNDAGSIESALREALERRDALRSESIVLRDSYRERWADTAASVWREILAARESAPGARHE